MDVSNGGGETKTWMGSSINDICRNQGPWSFSTSPVFPSKYHSVLFELPVNLVNAPKPHHPTLDKHWDEDHVRMPYSPNNLFPVTENGAEVIRPRWDIIEHALSTPIKTSRELEKAISSYSRSLPKLEALHHFFERVLDKDESAQFFENILPMIIKLALALPEIVPGNLPLLKKNHCRSVSLSQLQVASLMANAFLCTFPWRKDSALNYPGVNFTRLFASNSPHSAHVSEKLKCICSYFDRIIQKKPTGCVTFERKFIPKSNMPRWDNLDNNLGNTKIHISSTGTIEDDGLGMLQVDFANKFVGGGVLGYGCVQEEIRFVICPELIISRLFVERLGDSEAVIVTGAERYSSYSGYGETFKWSGTIEDETPFDEYGRRKTTISIIDATHFLKPRDQFYPSAMLRELNKAYVGFHSREKDNIAPVATGNWGCGAFRGNANLKSLIQLMACSASNRDLVYFSFGNEELTEEFYNMHIFLANNRITITQLWRFLCKFGVSQLSDDNLYSFIQQAYFDSKKQPTIKRFFTCTTQKPNDTINKPSTSKVQSPEQPTEPTKKEEVSKVVDESEDIIPSSQPEEFVYKRIVKAKKQLTPQDVTKKLPGNHNDILDILDLIDGNENKPSVGQNRGDFVENSFLSEIDKLKRRSKSVSDEVVIEIEDTLPDSEEIDVDVDEQAGDKLRDNRVIKKKITDYFSKN